MNRMLQHKREDSKPMIYQGGREGISTPPSCDDESNKSNSNDEEQQSTILMINGIPNNNTIESENNRYFSFQQTGEGGLSTLGPTPALVQDQFDFSLTKMMMAFEP